MNNKSSESRSYLRREGESSANHRRRVSEAYLRRYKESLPDSHADLRIMAIYEQCREDIRLVIDVPHCTVIEELDKDPSSFEQQELIIETPRPQISTTREVRSIYRYLVGASIKKSRIFEHYYPPTLRVLEEVLSEEEMSQHQEAKDKLVGEPVPEDELYFLFTSLIRNVAHLVISGSYSLRNYKDRAVEELSRIFSEEEVRHPLFIRYGNHQILKDPEMREVRNRKGKDYSRFREKNEHIFLHKSYSNLKIFQYYQDHVPLTPEQRALLVRAISLKSERTIEVFPGVHMRVCDFLNYYTSYIFLSLFQREMSEEVMLSIMGQASEVILEVPPKGSSSNSEKEKEEEQEELFERYLERIQSNVQGKVDLYLLGTKKLIKRDEADIYFAKALRNVFPRLEKEQQKSILCDLSRVCRDSIVQYIMESTKS